MSERDIEAAVREIICQRLARKPEEVVPGASFVDDLSADLLEVAELLMALQEAFNIVMDNEATTLRTVADAVRYVEAKVCE